MGSGAFRDGAGALERITQLTDENEQLRLENDSLRAEMERLASHGETGRVLRERNDLRKQLEDQRVNHIAAVKRLREEAADQRRSLEERLKSLGLDPAFGPETLANLRQSLRECHEIRLELERKLASAPSTDRVREEDALHEAREAERVRRSLAGRVAELEGKLERGETLHESNETAVRRRLIEDRDELARQVSELREELAREKARSKGGLLRRLFRSR